MRETNILKPLQMDGNYPFSQQYLYTQIKIIKIFEKFKRK
jgi:hypothetical protein